MSVNIKTMFHIELATVTFVSWLLCSKAYYRTGELKWRFVWIECFVVHIASYAAHENYLVQFSPTPIRKMYVFQNSVGNNIFHILRVPILCMRVPLIWLNKIVDHQSDQVCINDYFVYHLSNTCQNTCTSVKAATTERDESTCSAEADLLKSTWEFEQKKRNKKSRQFASFDRSLNRTTLSCMWQYFDNRFDGVYGDFWMHNSLSHISHSLSTSEMMCDGAKQSTASYYTSWCSVRAGLVGSWCEFSESKNEI